MDFKKELAISIGKALEKDDIDEIYSAIEVPPQSDMGDFAYPCFKLSKALRKAPNIIATELSEKIEKPYFIEEIKTASAYLNFFINKTDFVKEVFSDVIEKKDDYGKSQVGQGQNITIDYSSPNIAKPFHIGHLRTTVIGHALYNIYNFIGYNSFGINYLGDWGTQFGKLITAYKKWGSKEAVEEKGIEELTRIYVLFHDEAEKEPSLNDEARNWLLKMQKGDEEALTLWKWFVEISMVEFNRVYDMLDIKFDSFKGESFYNDKMDAVVDELKEKNLLVESDGAMIVDLEKFNMPPCLILRRDGGTLYPTRDIAAAIYRKKTYNFVKCLYVTALDQKLHFAQWFKVIELMGHEWAENLVHIPFGLVSLESGKLSTRKGNVVLLEELLKEAVSRTLNIIEEKNPDLQNKEEVAAQVGIGAVIFNDLYNSRIKDVLFSWDRILNFEGETGPYVQYTHARTASVLAKAGNINFENVDFSALTDEASVNVAKLIYVYTDRVIEAANKYEPFIISRYLMDLAQAFNKFYHDNSILNAEDNVKTARLCLVYSVKVVLKSGLALLGIKSPDKM